MDIKKDKKIFYTIIYSILLICSYKISYNYFSLDKTVIKLEEFVYYFLYCNQHITCNITDMSYKIT